MVSSIIEPDNLPESLQNKPRWMWCLSLTVAILIVIVSTIFLGAVLGYTYCYVEHRTSIKTGNVTHSTNFQIVHMPFVDTPEAQYNRTINGAIMSSLLMSKILSFGQSVVDNDLACISLIGDDHSSDIL